jgi:hypothetical protein
MAPKKTTPKKAAKKARKPKAKSAKKAGRASKAPKRVAAKRKPAKKSAAKKRVAKSSAKKTVARRSAPKKASAKKTAPKKSAPVRRRDHAGHIDPAYAVKLREQSGESGLSSQRGNAFIDGHRSKDSLAEELGEEAVGAMTTGEDESGRLEAQVAEEDGGPFVETDGSDEFADGIDESNPEDATREPFPTS